MATKATYHNARTTGWGYFREKISLFYRKSTTNECNKASHKLPTVLPVRVVNQEQGHVTMAVSGTLLIPFPVSFTFMGFCCFVQHSQRMHCKDLSLSYIDTSITSSLHIRLLQINIVLYFKILFSYTCINHVSINFVLKLCCILDKCYSYNYTKKFWSH